jgi:hypothetical protein
MARAGPAGTSCTVTASSTLIVDGRFGASRRVDTSTVQPSDARCFAKACTYTF